MLGRPAFDVRAGLCVRSQTVPLELRSQEDFALAKKLIESVLRKMRRAKVPCVLALRARDAQRPRACRAGDLRQAAGFRVRVGA